MAKKKIVTCTTDADHAKVLIDGKLGARWPLLNSTIGTKLVIANAICYALHTATSLKFDYGNDIKIVFEGGCKGLICDDTSIDPDAISFSIENIN